MTEWMSRLEQSTAGTIHDQLRAVVSEARDLIERFNSASWEQGGLLLDAQRELEAIFTQRISKVSEEVAGSIAALREEIAGRTGAGDASGALESLRSEVFTSLAAFGEELDAETKRLREDMNGRMDEMAAALASLKESQARMEERLAATGTSVDERLAGIITQIEALARSEDRSAQRMVDLLATAFDRLRDEHAETKLFAAR